MLKNRSDIKYYGILTVAIVCSLLVIAITNNSFVNIKPLQELEFKFIDDRFENRGDVKQTSPSDIVIVDINQDTYDQLPSPYNRWPWPRNLFAKLITNLNNAGAKAIGIDLIMAEQDANSPVNDSILYNAIKKYRNVVVAGKIDVQNELAFAMNKRGDNSKLNTSIVSKSKNLNFSNIFFGADSSVGIVQLQSDDDGVCRRYTPFVRSAVANSNMPSFGFAVLNKFYNLPSTYTSKNEDNYFLFNTIKIPKFDKTTFLINYLGNNPVKYFKSFHFIDIIDDKEFKTVDEIEFGEDINTWDDPDYGLLYTDLFKDKIVLIGSTMPEDKDLFPVPVSSGGKQGTNMMYGIHLHANAISNVLSSNFIIKQSKFEEAIIIIVLTFLVFLFSTLLRIRKRKAAVVYELSLFIIIAGLVSFTYFIGHTLFNNLNYLVPTLSYSLAIIIAYFGSSTYFFLSERKQNTVIKGMFSHYVSGALVNELLEDPEKLRLGGEKKNLTILFSDIVGFTPFSQNKTPEELVHFMNEYLSKMTNIVIEKQGTLDKYLGDAIMAFWGAPIPLKNDAYLACAAAIEMRKLLDRDYADLDENGKRILDMRIGINSGEVVVGNMGGEKRFDYTVMGDNVNLASRLEGANKQYGSHTMISESTYQQVEDKVVARVLDTITVKGRTIPTKVFELIGFRGDPIAEKIEADLEFYFKGLEMYSKKEFQAALILFDKAIQKVPEDRPTWTYLERCQYYIDNPPGENWNGVFELTTK